MWKRIMKRVLLPLALGLTVSAAGARTPDYTETGTVDGVNAEGGWVVINDQSFFFGAGLTVYDRLGNPSIGPAALKIGAPVGYRPDALNGQPYVTEIWVLDRLPPAQRNDEGVLDR